MAVKLPPELDSSAPYRSPAPASAKDPRTREAGRAGTRRLNEKLRGMSPEDRVSYVRRRGTPEGAAEAAAPTRVSGPETAAPPPEPAGPARAQAGRREATRAAQAERNAARRASTAASAAPRTPSASTSSRRASMAPTTSPTPSTRAAKVATAASTGRTSMPVPAYEKRKTKEAKREKRMQRLLDRAGHDR